VQVSKVRFRKLDPQRLPGWQFFPVSPVEPRTWAVSESGKQLNSFPPAPHVPGSRTIQLAPPLRGVIEEWLNKATQKLARSVPRLRQVVCGLISYFSPPPLSAIIWLSPLVPSNL
jgi:hypothetical protein